MIGRDKAAYAAHGRMDNYLPTGGVGVRCAVEGLTLIKTEMKRRWWRPWKKRPVTTPLAYSPHTPRKGDVVMLTQDGPDSFVVTSNDGIVLSYPPEQRKNVGYNTDI